MTISRIPIATLLTPTGAAKIGVSLTPFQSRVYTALLEVPKGQTITYKQLAERIGCRSAHAIGQAMKRNPFAVGNKIGVIEFTIDYCVPCHRVVSSDGSLGGFHGQRTGAQIERKQQLLENEKVLNEK